LPFHREHPTLPATNKNIQVDHGAAALFTKGGHRMRQGDYIKAGQKKVTNPVRLNKR
jgi:hypothetical protein